MCAVKLTARRKLSKTWKGGLRHGFAMASPCFFLSVSALFACEQVSFLLL